jgi:hypothetical protein
MSSSVALVAVDIAAAVHGCMVKAGLDPIVFLASAMVDMYARQ